MAPAISLKYAPQASFQSTWGGDPHQFAEAYSDWMFFELEGQELAYRTRKLQLPVPLRRNIGRPSGAACSVGVRKLLRCLSSLNGRSYPDGYRHA